MNKLIELVKENEDLNLEVNIYKSEADKEDEVSVYISHNGSSGYKKQGLKNNKQIAEVFLDYLENNM